MGRKDDVEWNSKRIRGCLCKYCDYRINVLYMWADDPLAYGAAFKVRDLKDGEVQVTYTDPVTKKAVRYMIEPMCEFLQPARNTGRLPSAKTGHHCKNKTCNQFNEYAAANQPDGSYLCFNCR